MNKSTGSIRRCEFVALVATYNRLEKTRTIIDQLINYIENENLSCVIVVVDNNSTDGTAQYLSSINNRVLLPLFTPDDMYWAESMRFGYDFISSNLSFSNLLVFNDDIEVKQDRLRDVFTRNEAVIVHNFHDEYFKHSYGGFDNKFFFTHLYQVPVQPKDDRYCEVFTCNMNLVVIPFPVIQKIGFLADYFIHRGADTEWGIRCSKAGFKILIPNFYVGLCNRNPCDHSPSDPNLSAWHRLKILTSKKYLPISMWFRYSRNYGGVFWPILFFVPYLRAVLK